MSLVASAAAPLDTWAESSEPSRQAHLELRGLYSQICGTCVVFRKHNPYSAPAELGLQVYGDYLPLAFKTPLGVLHVGPYGSISMIGEIGKISTGLAMTLRPENTSWEIFTQTGARYTSETMSYQYSGKPGAQGKTAFNLAIGARFYLNNHWYIPIAWEHDSNGSHVGVPLSEKDRSQNPGVDYVVVGFGRMF